MTADAFNTQSDLRTVLLRQAVSATPWFAIMDAAQDASSPQRAIDAGLQTECLYAGPQGAQLSHVAPHLCVFDFESPFADWWLRSWGHNHGVLVQSAASFKDVRKQLRRFLIVKNEAGKKLRFRFYDPRILRAFLPVCTAAELRQFFGPMMRYFVEGRGGATLCVFGSGAKGLTIQEHAVTKPAPKEQEQETRTRYGSLEVALLDQNGTRPLDNASVQLAGPQTHTAVSSVGGKVRFDKVMLGEYDIYAIDQAYRLGRTTVVVSAPGQKCVVKCRETGVAGRAAQDV
ncbi:MAG: DUF4123 domain-containing protein [Phycisphaerae bacterium]